MEKPKIYVCTTAYVPFVGGAEIAIQEVSRRLKDTFDVVIVTARMRRDLPKREVRPEGTVIRLGFGMRFDKWLLPVFALWKLKIENRKLKNCVLWGMDLSQGSVAAVLLKCVFRRVPFVFTLQYGYGDSRIEKGRWGMIGRSLSFILKRADYVTGISTYLLRAAHRYGYSGREARIPNGVDLARFHCPPGLAAPKKEIVITTSRLVPKNGIDILIRSFVDVCKKYPHAECLILGDGPERRGLEALSASLGLTDAVRFLGEVAHEDIPKHLWDAALFIRPSRSEGMGNSFVEALAAGVPIIGTRVGGIPDIISEGETGLFAKSDDPADCAEKIITLLRDKRLNERIRKNGERMVRERFGWDAIAAGYADVFSRVIKEHPLTILCATPLVPPRLGGPALYASRLAEEFTRVGNRVHVVSFDSYLRFPSGIRHLLYFLALSRKAFHADILFALDEVSVGIPASVVSLLFRIPLVFRVEGDFLWEKYVERTHRDITLKQFYESLPPLSGKERLIYGLSRRVLGSARAIVCSSEWRKRIVASFLHIPPENIIVIKNAWRTIETPRVNPRKKSQTILWAGRFLYLKNIRRLLRAFSKVARPGWELHLVGDGPDRAPVQAYIEDKKILSVRLLPPADRNALLDIMASASAFVLPSLSDVGPNVIIESLGAGTPSLMTRESGYAEYFRDSVTLMDPLKEDDIEGFLHKVMGGVSFDSQVKKAQEVISPRGWSASAREWMTLFKRISNTS